MTDAELEIWNLAIEAAAMACETEAVVLSPSGPYAAVARGCAEYIRGLKKQKPERTEPCQHDRTRTWPVGEGVIGETCLDCGADRGHILIAKRSGRMLGSGE